MTKSELDKIFDEVEEQLLAEFTPSKLKEFFPKNTELLTPSEIAQATTSLTINYSSELLRRVLSKALCKD